MEERIPILTDIMHFPGTGTVKAIRWPELPAGVKFGVAGMAGTRVFVGLGTVGPALFSLDTAAPQTGWTRLADFPGPTPEGAASTMAGGRLYVFSGSGKANPDDVSPIIFTDVHAYDPAADRWSRLDTQTPVGLLGASAHPIDEDRIVFFGGFNKNLFDRFQHDLAAADPLARSGGRNAIVSAFMGMRPEDYRWNRDVLVYTISTNRWSSLGQGPHLPNCGAALAVNDTGVVLVGGEIKPGLRTPMVKHVWFEGDYAHWSELPDLPAQPGDVLQEGLAGACAGVSDGVLMVAGGANFPGARARAETGHWYAHEALTKTWNAEIYALVDGAWRIAGRLPEALGYGACIQLPAGVLVAGGEDREQKARSDVFLLCWNGHTASETF